MTREQKDTKLAEIMVDIEKLFPSSNYRTVIVLADVKKKELSLFSNVLEPSAILNMLERAVEVEKQRDYSSN